MTVLNTDLIQDFPTIPIYQTDLVNSEMYMTFTNETTKEVYVREAVNRLNSNDIYYIGGDDFDFQVENTFYSLVVTLGANIVYKDRVFCTDQPLATYSVNKDQYNSVETNNNGYITI